MKRLLQTLTIALAIPVVSIAQNSVTITGTVSNDNGVVPNTTVTLSTPSTPAFPGEILAEVNTDENGFYIFQEDLEDSYPALELTSDTCNYIAFLDSMSYPFQGNIDIDCSTGSGGGDECEALFVFVPDSMIDGTIYYINASTGTDLEYLWDFGDGTESTDPYPSHTFADADAYYNVCLTIFGDGCESQYCDSVSGTFDGTATGPGLVGGNQSQQGEGVGTGFVFVVQQSGITGIEENLKEIDFNIYPNPSKGLVNINLDVQEAGSIMIVDLSGKIVFEANNINAQNSELALNSLNDGIYIIQFRSVNYISTSKLILQR